MRFVCRSGRWPCGHGPLLPDAVRASVSGERTFADRLEFRSVLPRRPDAAIGDHVAGLEQQLRVGDGTAQIPVGTHFVGWLVVVPGGIGIELLLAVIGRASWRDRVFSTCSSRWSPYR